jgi:predicted glutamine amidotransferase
VVPAATTSTLLEDLQALGWYNDDGWGIAFVPGCYEGCTFLSPTVYRGADEATSSTDFDHAQEIAAGDTGIHAPLPVLPHPGVEAMVAHIRNASSSCEDAPDPHPFIKRKRMFAHNGTVPNDVLLDLIEPAWLYDPSTSPETDPPVDSDLYFIYVLQRIGTATNTCVITQRIWRAIWDLEEALETAGVSAKLNMVYSDGTNLWSVRYAEVQATYYTVDYCVPADGQTWRAVASQPTNGCPGGWMELPNYRLIFMRPGRTPSITDLLQDPATAPACNIAKD